MKPEHQQDELPKFYYRVTIAYKGTRYYGWQAQAVDTSNEKRRTIEGTIKNALKKITNHQPCTVSGASRTDAGVHAQCQRAKLTIVKEINPDHLLLGLNSLLPADIRIMKCESSTKAYQPSQASLTKEYHYYFLAAPVDNVATIDIAQHLRIESIDEEDMERLQAACELFVGRHDFYNFCSRDKTAVTSIREISYCAVHKADFLPLSDDVYYLKVVGEGFLKYMVRYLMGALLALMRKQITLDDIRRYLEEHQEDKLSPKANAKGLHLIHIEERPVKNNP